MKFGTVTYCDQRTNAISTTPHITLNSEKSLYGKNLPLRAFALGKKSGEAVFNKGLVSKEKAVDFFIPYPKDI